MTACGIKSTNSTLIRQSNQQRLLVASVVSLDMHVYIARLEPPASAPAIRRDAFLSVPYLLCTHTTYHDIFPTLIPLSSTYLRTTSSSSSPRANQITVNRPSTTSLVPSLPDKRYLVLRSLITTHPVVLVLFVAWMEKEVTLTA